METRVERAETINFTEIAETIVRKIHNVTAEFSEADTILNAELGELIKKMWINEKDSDIPKKVCDFIHFVPEASDDLTFVVINEIVYKGVNHVVDAVPFVEVQSPVSNEVMNLLFLSILFAEVTDEQRVGVRKTIEERLEVIGSTPAGVAKDVCEVLNIVHAGNAEKIEAVLVPLWEARDGKVVVTMEGHPPNDERFSAQKTAQIKRMQSEISAMDDNIAEQQRDLNSLREDRKQLDLQLLKLIASTEQYDLFNQDEPVRPQQEPPAEERNENLTLPDLNTVTCGKCGGVFQVAENQNEIKEGVAYVVATLPKDIKKKFKKMDHVCGECYFSKIGKE